MLIPGVPLQVALLREQLTADRANVLSSIRMRGEMRLKVFPSREGLRATCVGTREANIIVLQLCMTLEVGFKFEAAGA